MIIRTNNQPRPIITGVELNEKQRKQAARDYDFLDDYLGSTFVVFKGHVHYLGNFERFGVWRPEALPELAEWTGVETDSMTTGTLIRIIDDETCVIGTFRC